jgi:hypothetical protein
MLSAKRVQPLKHTKKKAVFPSILRHTSISNMGLPGTVLLVATSGPSSPMKASTSFSFTSGKQRFAYTKRNRHGKQFIVSVNIVISIGVRPTFGHAVKYTCAASERADGFYIQGIGM